ncbi:MAG: 4'-phosphopantetheinyl transferase superfamily protein, partial [Lacunisphaera sp.]
ATITATAIPIGADRSPTWPPGIAGSITHTAEVAACVVARAVDVSALGIDLERARAVQPEIWDGVLTKLEAATLAAKPEAERSALATLIFSAKEAFFKMQYPLTKQWVDFHAAEVAVRETDGTFELVCTESTVTRLLGRRAFAGRYAVGPGLIVTAMHLIAPEK